MRLNKEEYNKYLEIHPKLIHYAGKKLGLVSAKTSFENFMNSTVEDKYPVRIVEKLISKKEHRKSVYYFKS